MLINIICSVLATTKMDLNERADNYFSTMNTMAARIHNDLNETKASYEELWNTLSPVEQDQILNESIIKPEVQRRYSSQNTNAFIKNLEYSSKIIFDDNNCSYRDEHSAPFSFQTKSQRDLSILHSNAIEIKNMKLINVTNKSVVKEGEPSRHDINLQELDKEENFNDFLPKTGLDFLDDW